MTNINFSIFSRLLKNTMLLLLFASIVPGAAFAADNTGTGDIAGDVGALTNSNTFTLLSTGAALALVKRAYLADGSPLTSGSTLATGTLVKFMVYVNNNASIATSDVSIQDVLDPLFAYQAGTIKVDNSVANCAAAACTPAEEAAIFAAADAAGALTDAVAAADVASFTGGNTVDAGNQSQANGQFDVAANTVGALLFSVRIQ